MFTNKFFIMAKEKGTANEGTGKGKGNADRENDMGNQTGSKERG